MHVRERQWCICPPVISRIPTHFLNEHLLVFFVTPLALRRQSDLCVCGCLPHQVGSVWCDRLVLLNDVIHGIVEFVYHMHELLTDNTKFEFAS